MGLDLVAALYPWDVLGDESAIGRLVELGVDRVDLAAYYHAVRAATPRHPDRRFVDASHSALYLDRRISSGDLHTTVPDWAPADAFLRARDRLVEAGVRVDAWVTPSHSDPASIDDDQHRVVDVFGQKLRHALCPNDPVAASFIDSVVGAVAAAGVDGLCVEALGQLGVDHAHLHDKTAGADWTDAERRLLSVCFCDACRARHRELDSDPDEIAAAVRTGLDGGRSEASAAIDRVEGPVLAVRSAGLIGRWSTLSSAASRASIGRVSAHATADRWATAPSAPLDQLPGLDVAIVDDWSADAAGLARVRAVRDLHAGATAAYVTVLPPTPLDPAPLAEHWSELARGGVTELHLYHLGLASDDRIALLHSALAAL